MPALELAVYTDIADIYPDKTQIATDNAEDRFAPQHHHAGIVVYDADRQRQAPISVQAPRRATAPRGRHPAERSHPGAGQEPGPGRAGRSSASRRCLSLRCPHSGRGRAARGRVAIATWPRPGSALGPGGTRLGRAGARHGLGEGGRAGAAHEPPVSARRGLGERCEELWGASRRAAATSGGERLGGPDCRGARAGAGFLSAGSDRLREGSLGEEGEALCQAAGPVPWGRAAEVWVSV